MLPEKANILDMSFDESLRLSFPPVMVQLLRMLLEPSSSFNSIAEHLKMDPVLAGRVLHIVNTGAYGFEEKITDLRRAATAIGAAELFKLVLVPSLQKKFYPAQQQEPEPRFEDWRLTLWSSMAAEAIAERLCPEKSRDAYLAGMLKDIALYRAFCHAEPPSFLRESSSVVMPEKGRHAEELAFWGRTHPEMGSDIFQLWGFPEDLSEAVRLHHDHDKAASSSPIAKSVIYATKWAELLHAPQTDLSALGHFERDMGAELGLAAEEMEELRAFCAERFNLLLERLGLRQDGEGLRLYDRSLADLQSLYFLALGTLGNLASHSPRAFASSMRRHLRLFWNIREWNMCISMKGNGEGSFFHCAADGRLSPETLPRGRASGEAGWCRIPFVYGKRDYGYLEMPPLPAKSGQGSLAMFAGMLGMHLEENRKRLSTLEEGVLFAELPFVLAKLDRKGCILQASGDFLDLFQLREVPEGMPARELLQRHLDIDLPAVEKEGEARNKAGCFLSLPEGHFPGTPLYLARSPAKENAGESYIFLGDVTRMSSLQALAMAHSGLLGALFDTLNEQVCLLDEQGRIIWTDESSQELLGRNIFSLSKPETGLKSGCLVSLSLSGRWNGSFLAGLDTSTRVQVMLAAGGTLVPYTLTFSPLEGKAGRQYLLMLHITSPAEDNKPPSVRKRPVKPKDSLTDLYGYSQFHMLLNHVAELARKQEMQTGIVFCDIEGLHKFNALHGCQKGDIMLRRVAGCLAENCRPGQDHACRYGSDKFAVIVSNATKILMDSLAAGIHGQVLDRCGSEIVVNLGLVLVEPKETPKARLDAARKASRLAVSCEGRTCWAD